MKCRGNALYQPEKVCQKDGKNRKKDTFCPFFAKFKFLCDFIACFDEKTRFLQKIMATTAPAHVEKKS